MSCDELFRCKAVSNSLQPQGLQHIRLPCPWVTLGVYSNSCPLSQWCFLTISFSVAPFSFCFQSFPVSGSFPMNELFALGGQMRIHMNSGLPSQNPSSNHEETSDILQLKRHSIEYLTSTSPNSWGHVKQRKYEKLSQREELKETWHPKRRWYPGLEP